MGRDVCSWPELRHTRTFNRRVLCDALSLRRNRFVFRRQPFVRSAMFAHLSRSTSVALGPRSQFVARTTSTQHVVRRPKSRVRSAKHSDAVLSAKRPAVRTSSCVQLGEKSQIWSPGATYRDVHSKSPRKIDCQPDDAAHPG